MATNQNGIAISLKAFVPMGKTIDEQLEVLTLVKQCHATGDYSPLLKIATIDQVKAEQKTRRIEDAPQGQQKRKHRRRSPRPTSPGPSPTRRKKPRGTSPHSPLRLSPADAELIGSLSNFCPV